MAFNAEPTPQDLASIEACRNLVVDCASLIDETRYDELTRVFAVDGVFARPTAPDAPITGCDAIIAAFKLRPANKLSQHMVFNIRVWITGPDTAEGTSSIMLYLTDVDLPHEPGKGRKGTGPLLGLYKDRYVRTAEGWRIADRRGRVTMYG